MMIKNCHTTIAVTTMLGPAIHMSPANLTLKVEFSVHDIFSIKINKINYPYDLRFLS